MDYANLTSNAWAVAAALLPLLLLYALSTSIHTALKLRHIPSCGADLPVLSLLDGLRFFFRAPKIIQYGYNHLRERPFKIPMFNRWVVVVASPKLIEELRRAPEDVLSFHQATDELLQMPHTLGSSISENPYHIPIIRKSFNLRNLALLFDNINEEMASAIHDMFPERLEEWKTISPMEMVMNIIARASNRSFVGLPLCRNAKFLEINTQFTIDVVTAAAVIENFPRFMRSWVSILFPKIRAAIRNVADMIEPLVAARRASENTAEDSYGTDSQQYNDFLSFLMQEARADELTTYNLARRILTANFVSLHTSSITFAHALLHLAAIPMFALALRKEVEEVTETYGWTYGALSKMHKVDSFLMESQRLNPLGALLMQRVAVKPFTFSDGTCIPPGTTVAVAVTPVHRDADNYANPDVFQPLRFMPTAVESQTWNSSAFTVAKTTGTFLAFGHGRHACPGRFFAGMELKLLLAQLVVLFDIQLPEGISTPQSVWIGSTCIVNPRALIQLRKRLDKT